MLITKQLFYANTAQSDLYSAEQPAMFALRRDSFLILKQASSVFRHCIKQSSVRTPSGQKLRVKISKPVMEENYCSWKSLLCLLLKANYCVNTSIPYNFLNRFSCSNWINQSVSVMRVKQQSSNRLYIAVAYNWSRQKVNLTQTYVSQVWDSQQPIFVFFNFTNIE